VHGLGILLIVAVSIPFVVSVIAFLMSKAGDWAWRSERNRGWAMLATGALYLVVGATSLLWGEPWPNGALFAAAGVVSVVIGLTAMVRASRKASSSTA